MDLHPDGGFLVVDDSEGDVKLYTAGGRLRTVIGRKGEGPGEFLRPAFAEFGQDGRIYVVDSGLNRLQVFRPDGGLSRTLNISEFRDIRGFSLLSDGSFLFLSGRVRDADHADVLLRTDTMGAILSTHLPIRDILPPDEKDDPAWQFARNFFMDVRGDTAFVITSVTNNLWRVSFPEGQVHATRIDFPDYDRPRLPPPSAKVQSGREMMDWFLGRHLAGFVRVTDETTFVPFIKGWMIRGDPVTLLHQRSSGDWEVIEDAPIVMDTDGERVLAVTDPATDDMRVLVYQPRGRGAK